MCRHRKQSQSQYVQDKVSAIILAGGNAERLAGRDKALLSLGGESLLERRIRLLSPAAGEIIVVSNNSSLNFSGNCRIVPDRAHGIGPLMGLYSGLLECRTSWAFVTACDMPFFCRELYDYMKEKRDGCDAVIPQVGKWHEPLFAFYNVKCTGAIGFQLVQKKRRISSFFPFISAHYVQRNELEQFDKELDSFFNVNTDEDLVAAMERDQGE